MKKPKRYVWEYMGKAISAEEAWQIAFDQDVPRIIWASEVD